MSYSKAISSAEKVYAQPQNSAPENKSKALPQKPSKTLPSPNKINSSSEMKHQPSNIKSEEGQFKNKINRLETLYTKKQELTASSSNHNKQAHDGYAEAEALNTKQKLVQHQQLDVQNKIETKKVAQDTKNSLATLKEQARLAKESRQSKGV